MEPADEGRLNINLQRRRTQAAISLLNADQDDGNDDNMELSIPIHVRPGENSPIQRRRSRGNLITIANEKEPLPNLGNSLTDAQCFRLSSPTGSFSGP